MNGKLDYRIYGAIWLPRDFLIIALENIFPPIPSEIVLPFGGFMTTYSNLTVPGVILAATCGSVVGAIILYGVGLLLDVERLEKIVDRWGYILKISKRIYIKQTIGLTVTAYGLCYFAELFRYCEA